MKGKNKIKMIIIKLSQTHNSNKLYFKTGGERKEH